MGFIDFLRKLKKEKTEEEKISFNEIGTLIEKKEKEISDKEKEIIISIKDKILEINKELEQKLENLEKVDVDSKKVEDRAKLIVKENLNNYIIHVKKFIQSLNSLEGERLERLIIKVHEIFSDFSKRSDMSYQKATFLIGKEIAAVRSVIIGLSKHLEKIFEENKNIIDDSKTVSLIKERLNQINSINESSDNINKRIKLLDEKIINRKERNKKILEDIEEIRKSSNYIKNLNEKEKAVVDEKELEKELQILKGLIDFKALGNVFHTDKKKMDIIKAHKENFQEAYNGLSILNLIKEAKLNDDRISTKVEKINEKKEEIIRNKELIKEDETKELLAEIKKIELEIDNLNNSKDKELKTCDKIKENKEEIMDLVKQEIRKINIEVLEKPVT